MTWRKSSRSETQDCVEVRGDLKAIRDSKNPEQSMTADVSAVRHLMSHLQAKN